MNVGRSRKSGCKGPLTQLLSNRPLGVGSPSSHIDNLICNYTLSQVQAALRTELRQTCDYWLRLPWCLCALAHRDEQKAREAAALARASFLQDPREAVHHRITWKLLHDGSSFRAGLDAFVDGTSRWECGDDFCKQVAVFACWPIAETTIEAKHARATMEVRRHHVGAVRISLSIRLPMLEQLLVRDPMRLRGLLASFEVW